MLAEANPAETELADVASAAAAEFAPVDLTGGKLGLTLGFNDHRYSSHLLAPLANSKF
jgi:hypothetical protein